VPSVRQTSAARRSSAPRSPVPPVSSAACSPHARYAMSDKDHADSPTPQPFPQAVGDMATGPMRTTPRFQLLPCFFHFQGYR
jgi:hypothetical protein